LSTNEGVVPGSQFSFTIGDARTPDGSAKSSPDLFGIISNTIESNTYLITLIWMAGAFVFSIRIATGFVYISAMKKYAVSVGDEWSTRLQHLADQINLKRMVQLAESSRIHVPVVVGYLKPLILIPAGMIGGLSAEQLESILIHELMHIKRNDYVVNIIQTFAEALFFFNPFVWIVSSIIRREREHCCDDEVVKHANALAYAHALAQLEELNLANRSLVLSLAENKNQLLKRIKRIMEKSVQNYSVKERMTPVVLLVIGLTCASWLTIKSPVNDLPKENQNIVSADTAKPEKRSRQYSRKTITVRDSEGNPIEIVQSFDGDEELVSLGNRFEYEIPPLPPIPAEDIAMYAEAMMPVFDELEEMAEIPAIAPFPEITPFPDMFYSGDTFPTRNYTISVRGDWGVKEFEVKLKEKFGDFYDKNSEEIQKMMREISEDIAAKAEKEWKESAMHEVRHNETIAIAQLDRQRSEMNYQQRVMEKTHAEMEQLQREQEMHHLQLEKEMKVMEDRMKTFEKKVKDELVKDGYLGKNEKLETMNWSDDDVLTVNGKKIKETDQKKYAEIREKFFDDSGHTGRPE
jgi:beta-lactamase regulating signal transducer with metallopeptidase domain